MEPLSEIQEHEWRQADEDETEVYVLTELDLGCKVKCLENWSHLIDSFENRRVSEPSEKVRLAYFGRESAAEAAKKVKEEESRVREGLEEQIELLQTQLELKIKDESRSRETYLERTGRVMRLEMEEPCRWNIIYRRLREYVRRTGDLPPAPCACTSEHDRRLSIFVQEMKSLVYSGSGRMAGAPHRVEALESLGVEWIESGEARWNRMHSRLVAYRRQHGTARLPTFMQCRRTRDRDLIALRHWVDSQEAQVKSGVMSMAKLRKLQALGLPLKLTWEQEWEHYIVELLKFRSKHAHLYISGDCHSDLGEFVSELLSRLSKDSATKLTADEKNELHSKGLLRDLKDLLRKPKGRPSANRGQAENAKLVPLERVKEVNCWAFMLQRLKAYQAEYNTLDFPPPLPTGGEGYYNHLRDWVEDQRESYQLNMLEESRIKSLAKLGLAFDPWEAMFQKLRRFKKEAGTARLPKNHESDGSGRGDELAKLCKWVQDQICLYRNEELEPEKKKKLRKLGVYLTKGHMGKVPWEDRFDEMINYYHLNKTCLPQRDGPLRQWVLELVDLVQNGYVSQKRQRLINETKIGPYLRPEVIFKDSLLAKRRVPSSSDDVFGDDKRIKMANVISAAECLSG